MQQKDASRKGLVVLAIIMVLVLTGITAACGSQSGPKSVSGALANDIQSVQTQVETFQTALGLAAQSQSQSDLVTLASVAQTAHSQLDNLKQQIASDAPTNGPGGDLFNAVNELKNTMGAVGTYISSPNANSLASFKNQYQQAISDWNQAVSEIYAGTAQTPPSTLGT